MLVGRKHGSTVRIDVWLKPSHALTQTVYTRTPAHRQDLRHEHYTLRAHAGKTTLMDVLAGRKTGGRTDGEQLLNGHTKAMSTLSRVMGYVEQFDVHNPQVGAWVCVWCGWGWGCFRRSQ